MDRAALPGRLEEKLAQGLHQPQALVRDHQSHPAQAPLLQVAQERTLARLTPGDTQGGVKSTLYGGMLYAWLTPEGGRGRQMNCFADLDSRQGFLGPGRGDEQVAPFHLADGGGSLHIPLVPPCWSACGC